MLRVRPLLACLSAGVLAVSLAACSAEEPESQESSAPAVSVDVDEAPSAEADAGGEGEDEGQPGDQDDQDADEGGEETDEAAEQDDQLDVEILTGTGEELSDYPAEAPAGLSEDEWADAWYEAQKVAREYLVVRNTLSYTDSGPNEWLDNTAELTTPEWQEELASLRPVDWDMVQADEMGLHAQIVGYPRLAYAHTFNDQEMIIFMSYRTWETNRYGGNGLPSGWDLYENDFGAPGSKFTSVELKNVDGQWLVDGAGRVPVTGLGD